MNIRTWQVQSQEDGGPWRLQAECYMQAEIDELRTAFKTITEEHDALTVELSEQRRRFQEWRDSATFAVDSLKEEIAILRAENERLVKQCELFGAQAYKSKVEAKTLVLAAEERLAAWEKQEPVAWMTEHPMLFTDLGEAETYCDDGEIPEPLYTKPKEQL